MNHRLSAFGLFLLLNLLSSVSLALTSAERLSSSKQLLLVSSTSFNAVNGKLQFYERRNLHSPWIAVGPSKPVVVGQGGMGWGVEFKNQSLEGPRKQEGDLKTPIGVFELGPAFGFAASEPAFKLSYFPLTATSVCVDDPRSSFYNEVLDSANLPQSDWQSAEEMRKVSLYEEGAVIQYNHPKPTKGAGSCIFLHIWRSPDRGTAGCIALAAEDLKVSLIALDPLQKPVIAILPQPAYGQLKAAWQLPP